MSNRTETAFSRTPGMFLPGQLVAGKYQLLLPVAEGGMGTIWAARIKGPMGYRRHVAIKTMRGSVSGIDPTLAMNMFAYEAKVTSRIRHPNVVEVMELGEDTGSLYIAMELIHGESLSRIMEKAVPVGGMPMEVASNIVGQLCRGLHAAHELRGEDGNPIGLVHRDISLPNVLVTYDGVVKIIDFGIVKTNEESFTTTNEMKGKVAYAAPEQIASQPLDRRADIFALGIVLYVATTGRHPFRGRDVNETLMNVLNVDPPRPTTFVVGYPPALEEIIYKAIAKHPDDRWNTAEEMLYALEAAMPLAFSASGDIETRIYMNDLLRESRIRREAVIANAEERFEMSSHSGIVLKPPSDRPTPVDPVPAKPEKESSAPPFVPRQRLLPTILSLTGVVAAVGSVFIWHARGAADAPTTLPVATPASPAALVGDGPVTIERDPQAPMAAPAATAAVTAPAGGTPVYRRAKPRPKSDNPYAPIEGEDAMVEEAPAPDLPDSGLIPPAAPAPPLVIEPATAEAPAWEPSASSAPLPAKKGTFSLTVAAGVGHRQLRTNPNAVRPSLPRTFEGMAYSATAQICVNPSGLVQSVTLSKSTLKGVDGRVADTLKRWQYKPLIENGKPRAFCYSFFYSF